MRRPRSAPRRTGLGVVTSVATSAALLAGCASGPVPVEAVELDPEERATCSALLDALPETVSDQGRRTVEPQGAPAAAWGDPAIVLRCGVGRPSGFDRFAACQETDGVGWFVPEAAFEDQAADVVMTTIGREVNVEVALPGRYRPPAAAMVDLAPAIKRAVPEVDPCV